MKTLQFIPRGAHVFLIDGALVREDTVQGFVIRSGMRGCEPEILITYVFGIGHTADAENVFETRGEALDALERWGERRRYREESGRTVYRSSLLGITRSLAGWDAPPAVWVK